MRRSASTWYENSSHSLKYRHGIVERLYWEEEMGKNRITVEHSTAWEGWEILYESEFVGKLSSLTQQSALSFRLKMEQRRNQGHLDLESWTCSVEITDEHRGAFLRYSYVKVNDFPKFWVSQTDVLWNTETYISVFFYYLCVLWRQTWIFYESRSLIGEAF